MQTRNKYLNQNQPYIITSKKSKLYTDRQTDIKEKNCDKKKFLKIPHCSALVIVLNSNINYSQLPKTTKYTVLSEQCVRLGFKTSDKGRRSSSIWTAWGLD